MDEDSFGSKMLRLGKTILLKFLKILLSIDSFDKRSLIDNLKSLGVAIFIVLIIRSSLFEAFKIPSGSMIPTLFIGDHIFVNKMAYGLKVPFADSFIDKPVYIQKGAAPERGDIIVFLYPEDESVHYIKRVIGTPGDTVEVRNKMLYVNNKPVPREPLAEAAAQAVIKQLGDRKYDQGTTEAWIEHLSPEHGNVVDHVIFLDKEAGYVTENFSPVTVPSEHLFVMGDNRDFSKDSRFWGFVPFKNVKGKAAVIFFSYSVFEGLAFHPDRIGTLLH